MNFLKRLFRKPKIETTCPRCLGKGNVDWQDIRRLNRELIWVPGTCAYCNGSGSVEATLPDKLPADTSYLTTDISERERQQLIDGNRQAIRRGQEREQFFQDFINEIVYHHFTAGMDRVAIAGLLLTPHLDKFPDEQTYEQEKRQLLEYIDRVIEKHIHLHN